MNFVNHEVPGSTVSVSSNSVSIEEQNVPESSPNANRTPSPTLLTICPLSPLLHGHVDHMLRFLDIQVRHLSAQIVFAVRGTFIGYCHGGAGGIFPRWTLPKLTPFVEDGNHEGLKHAPLRPTFSYSDRHHSADRRLRTCLFRCCGADCGARGETLFIWRPTQPSRKKSSGELFYEWRRGVRQGKAAKSGQASICVTGEENRASLRQACTGGGCAAVPARRRFRFRYRVSEERGTHDPSFRKMSTVRNLTRWQ